MSRRLTKIQIVTVEGSADRAIANAPTHLRKVGSELMQREELPDQVWVILSLFIGTFLLGDGLFWNETLRPASTLHRVILEAIGAVFIAFAIYLFVRMRRRRAGP
jgi:hypothetical protein